MLHTKILAGLSICFPVSVFGQGTVASDFVCPAEDIANTQCSGPRDCLYPDPKSCTSYINCEVSADGTTATAYILDCPAGLQ
jgi:hypothetical protein